MNSQTPLAMDSAGSQETSATPDLSGGTHVAEVIPPFFDALSGATGVSPDTRRILDALASNDTRSSVELDGLREAMRWMSSSLESIIETRQVTVEPIAGERRPWLQSYEFEPEVAEELQSDPSDHTHVSSKGFRQQLMHVPCHEGFAVMTVVRNPALTRHLQGVDKTKFSYWIPDQEVSWSNHTRINAYLFDLCLKLS